MTDEPDRQALFPLDIGVVCAGTLSAGQQRLIRGASRQLQLSLQQHFPDYHWQLHFKQRRDIGEFSREESSHLLRLAADERDTEHWDLVLLVSADELIARYRRFALAALSRPLDAAVLSLARLEPGGDSNDEARVVDRLGTLMLHAIGHLGGLTEEAGTDSFLYRPDSPAQLDTMTTFSPAQLTELQASFATIADTRLEDEQLTPRSQLAFLVRAAWINRSVISEAVLAARPWQFPLHLNRLSTAAVSTVAVLLMTAESWDLGLSQTPASLVVTGLIIWALTTGFVLSRQQLLLSRHRQLSEQIAVTRISAVLIVMAGLAVTWLSIGALALLASSALFEPALIQSWAASTNAGANASGALTYVKMASFCATIGLLIGSLGASFEDQHHFQHVVFVDAEL